MRNEVRPAVTLLLALSLVTGVAYPGLVTALASLLFPRQASGTLVERGGRCVGSALIGQPFCAPRYFRSRPSATTPFPYDALASGGSNRGPLDPALREEVQARVAALRAESGAALDSIPTDLVTASASGLDPHVSVRAALLQADRVARVRGLPVAEVRRLIAGHTEARTFGVLGEPRVNVLLLNLALDDLDRGRVRREPHGRGPERWSDGRGRARPQAGLPVVAGAPGDYSLSARKPPGR